MYILYCDYIIVQKNFSGGKGEFYRGGEEDNERSRATLHV